MTFHENLKRSGLKLRRKIHNRLNALRVREAPLPVTELRELNEVLERSRKRTPMADHLVRLFSEALVLRPRLIVELGVGPAESTFVFERVARLTGCTWLSVDIEDRSKKCAYPAWNFVCADDVAFARDFPAWCGAKNIPAEIDLLFIDTSHYYEHTLREIESYFPFLSPRAKVFFHDTNLRSLYVRRNGRMEMGWDNQRGVIRAIEEYLGKRFDERRAFVDYAGEFLVRHHPYSCGLTILERAAFGKDDERPAAVRGGSPGQDVARLKHD